MPLFQELSISALKVKFPKPSALSPAAQSVAFRQRFPHGRVKFDRKCVNWIGELSPTDYSRNYTVEMSYRFGSLSSTFVRQPNLKELVTFSSGSELQPYAAVWLARSDTLSRKRKAPPLDRD